MKRLVLLFIWLSLLIGSKPALAVRVPGLYESEVIVQDQEAGSRRAAVRQAMGNVLVKLTGDRNAPSQVSLKPVIDTSENYVQQYRYLEVPVSGEPDAPSILSIRVRFDESNLNNALRNLGVRVWGRERPSTLVWLAMEEGSARRILEPEEDPDVFHEISERAKDRGIVIINPLFDLQDRANLRVSDIWGGFHFTVKNASQRYYPDLILTGKVVSPLPEIWEAQWTLYLPDEERNFSTQGSYLESVLNEGINGVADLISGNFIQGETTDIGVALLKVIDVISLQQYARILNYLQALSPVTNVEVNSVNPGNIEFTIFAHGGEQAIVQAINFGRVLEEVAGNQKIYRLLP